MDLYHSNSNNDKQDYELSEESKCIQHERSPTDAQEEQLCPICFGPLNIDGYFDCQNIKQLCESQITENKCSYKDKKSIGITNRTIQDDDMCLTPCGHSFHYQCIHRWMETKTICPQCRGSLDLTDCKIVHMSEFYNSFFSRGWPSTIPDQNSPEDPFEVIFYVRNVQIKSNPEINDIPELSDSNEFSEEEEDYEYIPVSLEGAVRSLEQNSEPVYVNMGYVTENVYENY